MAIGFLVLQLNYLLQALAGNRTGWKGCSEPRHVVVPAPAVLVPDGHHQTQAPLDKLAVADRENKVRVEAGLNVLIKRPRPPVAHLEVTSACGGAQEVDQGVGVLRPLAAQPGLAQRHVEAGPGVPDAAAQPPGVRPLVLRHRHDLPLQRPPFCIGLHQFFHV